MISPKSLIVLALACLPAFAQDWPQWGGPGRDFKSTATGLRTRWPAGGPPRLWNRSLGEGHAASVAEGARLYTMYRKGDQEVVIALDARTGKTIWEYSYAAPYLRGMDMTYGDGPHATPLIVGQSLYTVGATAKLFCLDIATGKPRWNQELWQGFTGGTHTGYSSSPLADKNTLIMQAAGGGGSFLACDLDMGLVVLSDLNFRIPISGLMSINVDGQDQLVVFTHGEILVADPNDGSLLWSRRIAAQWEFHFTISTPIWGPGNLLFASAAYGVGGRVLHLSRSGDQTIVKELWQSERARVHKENAIRLGDVLDASTGHLGPAFFTAIDVRTGKVLWQDRRFSHANFVYADGKFIILDEDGALGLATPTSRGLTVHSRVEILTSRSWTAPTLVGRTLYLRDRKNIMALQL